MSAQPGEVWMLTKRRFTYPDPDGGQSDVEASVEYFMPMDQPMIVTKLTRGRVWFACASEEGLHERSINLDSRWDWDEHFTRIWPPVPSWEELRGMGVMTGG